MMSTERADLLISHVVDGEATAEHWRELEGLAAQEPRLWRELAEAQRDAASLRSAMRSVGDIAERVALPELASPEVIARIAPDTLATRTHAAARTTPHPHVRLNRIGAWTGWLAAAMVAIIATVQYQRQSPNADSLTQPNSAGLGSGVAASASDLFNQYLETGQKDGSVLGEVPGKMLVESRPVTSGQGYEIIFVRQVVERAIVPDLFQIEGVDDRGQATLARYRQPVRKTM